MPALDRAFAFSEMHDVAERVAEYLNFNVARPVEIPFEINARVAKRIERFRGGVPPRGGHLACIGDQAHAFSAAARHGLEQHGIAKLLRDAPGILRILDWLRNAGNHRHSGPRGELTGGGLRSKALHRFG